MYLNKYSNNCNHTDRGSDDYKQVGAIYVGAVNDILCDLSVVSFSIL
jgi:hypothetical protein